MCVRGPSHKHTQPTHLLLKSVLDFDADLGQVSASIVEPNPFILDGLGGAESFGCLGPRAFSEVALGVCVSDSPCVSV